MRKFSRKHTKKSRRQQRKSRRQRRQRTSRRMHGGEDPKLSEGIYNYNISDLPHRVSA